MGKIAHGTFVESELILSQAFKELKETGLKVLLVFLLKKPMEKINGKWIPKEEGREIPFTYSEAEKKHGITRPRFTRALDDLIDKGFIDLKYQGGGMQGDQSLYRLSQMWRNYGTDDFKVMRRPKKGLRIGFIKKSKSKNNYRNPAKKIRRIRGQ